MLYFQFPIFFQIGNADGEGEKVSPDEEEKTERSKATNTEKKSNKDTDKIAQEQEDLSTKVKTKRLKKCVFFSIICQKVLN